MRAKWAKILENQRYVEITVKRVVNRLVQLCQAISFVYIAPSQRGSQLRDFLFTFSALPGANQQKIVESPLRWPSNAALDIQSL